MSTLVARPLPARRSNDQRHALVAVAHVRLMMLMLLIAAGFLLVIGRIALLGLIGGPAGAATLAINPVVRGDILDRNGQPLARTIEAWTIGVRPGDVLGDRQELAGRLAGLMPEHDFGLVSRPADDEGQVHLSGQARLAGNGEPDPRARRAWHRLRARA